MTKNDAPRARDVLGMPVPPAWLVAAVDRLRGWLGRIQARSAPPSLLVLERLFGMVDSKALFVAVDLGIPDLLASGPRSAAEIAAVHGGDADAIERVMRYLVGRDLFRRQRDGRYANNGATAVLAADHPYSWRDWVLFLGSEWSWRVFNEMPKRVRDGAAASETAFGVPFFAYLNHDNPAAGGVFNGAMAAGARLQALLFAETIDLTPFASLCDVGGGTGQTLANVLRQHPRLRGTVFDLPELAADAATLLRAAGVEGRAVFAGGDFFASVPDGHDLYTLFAVVHDWDDDRCVRILANIGAAMNADGRVKVIERPLPRRDGADFSKASDMLMLVLGDGGRERSQAEYRALFTRAGFRVVQRTVLPSLFEVFELARASPVPR